MVLYVIGLGLGDEKDITLRGLETVRKCKKCFLEYYTSIIGIDHKKLSEFYGVEVILADRDFVESEAERIYEPAMNEDIGLLVVGDPLCATTHTDIILRARNLGIKVEVIHNTSVMGAIASNCLQLYKFGYTISIPFFETYWRPSSFYHRLRYNNQGGMHTLCLLDIKVKEPNYDAMMAGKLKYMPPRFMTVNQAIEQLLEVEDKYKQNYTDGDTTYGIGMARLGMIDQLIVYGTLNELRYVDFGEPLHCLAIVCKDSKIVQMDRELLGDDEYVVDGVHPIEIECLEHFSIANSKDLKYITTNVNHVDVESVEDDV